MARKKIESAPAKAQYLAEAVRIEEDGKRKTVSPGRVAADLSLSRLHVLQKRTVIELAGEYHAELSYTSK